MATMRAIQVAAKGEPMTLVEIPIPQPGKGQVLLKVEACGICHGDSKVIEGAASSYPRIPGHEVVGIVDKLGDEVSQWKVGQRVGIGWHGGHGHTGAGTNGNQQGVVQITEGLAGDLLQTLNMLENVGSDLIVDLPAIGIVLGAGLGADGEALGNRHAGGSHLCQASALAAQDVLHGGHVTIECLDAFVKVVQVLFAHYAFTSK